jgi:hypothetical protein
MLVKNQYGLIADIECWKFKRENPEEWATFGCGPGGVGDILVPDTMWGLNISEACRVHDWYYRFYYDRSASGKMLADELMLQNTRWIIKMESDSRTLKYLRNVRAKTYYVMVSHCGQSSWDDCKSVRDK